MKKYSVFNLYVLKKGKSIFVCRHDGVLNKYIEISTKRVIKNIDEFDIEPLSDYYSILESFDFSTGEAVKFPVDSILRNVYSTEKEKNSEIEIRDYNKINDFTLFKEKLEDVKIANINVYPNDKKCLFIMGMLFASGININILNEDELDLTETKKSFSMMPYVWSRIGKSNISIKSEMDKRIENINRLGVKVEKIKNNPIDNKLFLICPVRNATKEQKEWIESFVKEKQINGSIVHAPHLHTVQDDMFGGYAICRQNAEAVASSSEVDIYYDKNSTGSIFDLGVAYALEKPIEILNSNEIMFNINNFSDNLIIYWPYRKEENKVLKKSR